MVRVLESDWRDTGRDTNRLKEELTELQAFAAYRYRREHARFTVGVPTLRDSS